MDENALAELKIKVALGDEVSRLLQSHHGEHIIKRRDEELQDLFSEFMSLKNGDVEKMKEIHHRASVANEGISRLIEVLIEADEAYELLTQGQ